jgi:hypothetical protein
MPPMITLPLATMELKPKNKRNWEESKKKLSSRNRIKKKRHSESKKLLRRKLIAKNRRSKQNYLRRNKSKLKSTEVS